MLASSHSIQNFLLIFFIILSVLSFKPAFSQFDELVEKLIEDGKFSDAIEVLDKILEENPNDVQVIYLRGLLYAQLGEHEEAIKNYDVAFSLSHGNEDILKSKSFSETALQAKSYVEGLATPIQPYYLESIFYGREIIADGDDSEWLEIKSKSKTFEGFNIDLSSSNELSGQILVQNNENILGILLKLHTPIPVKGNEHSILISFDENGDGFPATGDNVLFIKTIGDGLTTTIRDAYVSEDGLKDDPPEYQGETEAKIRYSGERELLVEVLVPFKNVNNFYDFEMLVERDFTIKLNYNVVDWQTFDESSFNSIFFYTMSQDSSISVNPALQIFSIFGATILASVVVAAKITKKDTKTKLSKKLVVIIFAVLIISALIVIFNPQFENEMRSFLISLTKIVESFGPEAGFYSAIAGLVVGIICFKIFRKTKELVSNFSISQKIVLYCCIAIFVISLMSSAANPFLFVVKSVANASSSENIYEQISPHINSLLDVIANLFTILILPTISIMIVWIPTLFLIFVLSESRGKKIKLGKKAVVILSAIVAFVIFSGWFMYSLYYESSFQENLIGLLIGPIISGAILSFLAAEGYINTIKENLHRLRTGLSPKSNDGKSPKNARRFYAVIALIVNFAGISRYLLLLSVPLVYLEFPEFYSITSQGFVEAISWYSIDNFGQTKEGAQVVYNSFIVLFSIFWLYDVVMILRGFSDEYLNSDNRIFRFFKDNIGIFSAILFLCIIIIFMSFQTVFIDSSRINEMVSTLPSWVREQTGTQEQSIEPLEEIFLNLSFVWGLSALAGIIYVLKRTVSSKKEIA